MVRQVARVTSPTVRIEVVARYSNEEGACPRCGRTTWHVHQWSQQRKQDANLWSKSVWVLLWKRRFGCRIFRKVFTQADPARSRRRPTTRRSRHKVAHQANEASVRAVARWHGVSERLGHSGVGITLGIYSHVLPGLQAEAAAELHGPLERPYLKLVSKMLANAQSAKQKRPRLGPTLYPKTGGR